MDLRSLARSQTAMALRTLCGIAENSANDSARVQAAVALLDRGWGKPPQAHTGPDGDGEIRVTIRHILDGRDVPEPREANVIDERPLARLVDGEGEP